MASRYQRGVRYERELLHILDKKGFAVIRAAGSGGNVSVPDIIGIRKGQVIAFECKAWEKEPYIKKEKIDDFIKWCKKADAFGFIAWRHENKWKFKPIEDIKNKEKEWVELHVFLSVFL